jgi:hypothetical protein
MGQRLDVRAIEIGRKQELRGNGADESPMSGSRITLNKEKEQKSEFYRMRYGL